MDDYVFELNQCTNKEQPVLIVVQRQCIVTPTGLFLLKSFGIFFVKRRLCQIENPGNSNNFWIPFLESV